MRVAQEPSHPNETGSVFRMKRKRRNDNPAETGSVFQMKERRNDNPTGN
jgi:hypothetical protein